MTTVVTPGSTTDSGVEWLGQIPSHWVLRRIKDSVLYAKNGVWGDDEKGNDEDIWCVRVADFNRNSLSIGKAKQTIRNVPINDRSGRVLRRGDLVLEKSGGGVTSPVGFMVAYNYDEPAVCSNFAAKVRLTSDSDPQFWLYIHAMLYSQRITQRSIKQTSGIQNLDQSSYFNEVVGVPPLAEQRQIAEYLDRETGQIEALITKQERLVETLAERQHSLHSERVAAQIARPDKRAERVKALYSVVDERRGGGSELPLLSVSIHRGVQRRDETTDDEPRASDLSSYKVCRKGDIVINRMRAFQGALGRAPIDGVVSPDYLVLRPLKSVDSEWLALVFRSAWFVGEMTARLRGIGATDSGMIRTPRINAADLGDIRIHTPSTVDQLGLVQELDLARTVSDTLIAKAGQVVEVLKERRQALISAAVTGEIDVRGL